VKLLHPNAFAYIPSGEEIDFALRRTTHLSIGAHPDDLEFMSFHGISSCYKKSDAFFTGIVVTDGAGSVKSGPYAGVSSKELIKIRAQEQKKGADIGKYNALIMLQYESSDLQSNRPIHQRPWLQDLQSLFTLCRPQTVYSHNPFDKHPTHLAVILPLIQFLQSLPSAQRPERLYGCEVWRGLDWVLEEDRTSLPIDRKDSLAEELNQVFISQIEAGKNYAEAIRGRRIANATFTNPHLTDPAPQMELALDLSPLLPQTPDQIIPHLKSILDRFQAALLTNLRKQL
jgi:LmbE family N-acetylglucosaminyl deacetylase